jgi:hypothetical protein
VGEPTDRNVDEEIMAGVVLGMGGTRKDQAALSCVNERACQRLERLEICE